MVATAHRAARAVRSGVLAVALFACLAGPAQADDPPLGAEQEPNGTSGTATPIALAPLPNFYNPSGPTYLMGIATGAITPGGDVDYFSFVVPNAGLLGFNSVWVYADTGAAQNAGATSRDTVVSLRDTDANSNAILETDDDDGTGNGLGGSIPGGGNFASAIAGRNVASGGGTYYLEVKGFAPASAVDPYTVYVVVTVDSSPVVLEGEPNDTPSPSNPILAGTAGQISGSIGSAGDLDYYAIDALAGNVICTSVDGNPERDGTNTAVQLELLQPAGAFSFVLFNTGPDGSSGPDPRAEAFCYRVPLSQSYYVGISSRGGSTGSYSALITSSGMSRTWTGVGGNALWTTAANWIGNVAPVANDTLVFDHAVAVTETTDMGALSGTDFNEIHFKGDGSAGTGFVLGASGQSSGLRNGIAATNINAAELIVMDVTLLADQTWFGGSWGFTKWGDIGLGSSSLTLRDNGPPGLETIVISGSITGTGGVRKTGTGCAILTGVNTYTGPTWVVGGTSGQLNQLIITGNQPGSNVQVGAAPVGGSFDPGAHLGGNGKLGTVTTWGEIGPGTDCSPGSKGILTTGNFDAKSQATLTIATSGNVAGTSCDRLSVNGTVSLGNMTLNLIQQWTPPTGTTLTILANDGADGIVGTFKNLPEGSTLAAGSVSYRISYTGGDGNDAVLTVLPNPPTVTAIMPALGPTAGGTAITLTGTNFEVGGTAATIDGTAATGIVVNSPTQLTAQTPAGTAGAATVTVTTAGGSASLTNGYTYVAPPTLTAIDPASGAAAGGTTVTLTGTNFVAGNTTVTFGGRAATSVVVTSATRLTAVTPALARAPVTVTVTTPGGSASLVGGFSGVTLTYFAEGATSAFFGCAFALVNPSATQAADVTLRFLRTDGTTVSHTLTVPPRTRRTVNPATVPGLGVAEFSTVVEATAPVVVDRTMTWDSSGYGSHAETSVMAPSTVWYLAEGATHSGFDLFYLVQNPNATVANVQVTYLLTSGPPVVKTYAVAPNSRFNIWVNNEALTLTQLANAEMSARITSDVAVIVERAMYLDSGGLTFGAGHESAGVTTPATSWFLAEGATGSTFDLFLLIANPNAASAAVTATYLLPSGTTLSKSYTVPGNSRFNIWVDQEEIPPGSGIQPLADVAVSASIASTNGVPIIVERAMWWPGPTSTTWHEAHNSPGATATGTRWALAEGEVGGSRGLETYILIANTSAFAGSVQVTLLFEDGTTGTRVFTVPANSRFNVSVAAEFPAATGKRFGALVESLGGTPAQLVVERAMYSNAGGVVWAAGTNALATRLLEPETAERTTGCGLMLPDEASSPLEITSGTEATRPPASALRRIGFLDGPEEVCELLDPPLGLVLIGHGREHVSPGGHILAPVSRHGLAAIHDLQDHVDGERPIVALGEPSQIGRRRAQVRRQRAVALCGGAVTAGAVALEARPPHGCRTGIVALRLLGLRGTGRHQQEDRPDQRGTLKG